MSENTETNQTLPQSSEEVIRIVNAKDVVSYLEQLKTALNAVNQYIANIENDLDINIYKINEEKQTDAS